MAPTTESEELDMQVDGDVEALSSGDRASQQNEGVGREVWVTRRRVLGVGQTAITQKEAGPVRLLGH